MKPWTLENVIPSGEIGTFPTYSSLVRAQPFLSFPYVNIKMQFLMTTNDTGQEWSMLFTSQSMTSKQRCTHDHPLIFVVFWLRACGTHTLDFWSFLIECKCRTMVEWSQFITFANSRVHWCGSLWINVFKRSSSKPECRPERAVWLMSKDPP